MTDEIKPTAETAEASGQGTPAPGEKPQTTPPTEAFDAERAMNTIRAQREEAKALKAQLKELEILKAEKKAKEDAELSELERLRKQSAEAAELNARLQMDILRRDVVAETGLPAALSDRLKGATRDELLEDAKKLLELLPAQTKTPPRVPTTNPANGSVQKTDKERREEFFGKPANLFDAEQMKAMGGGVIFHKTE